MQRPAPNCGGFLQLENPIGMKRDHFKDFSLMRTRTQQMQTFNGFLEDFLRIQPRSEKQSDMKFCKKEDADVFTA